MKKYTLLLFLLFIGCGIITYVYLESPIANKISNHLDYDASFFNNPENDPQYFKGFCLFYKFFESKEQLETSKKQIENTSYNAVNYMKTKGFKKIKKVDATYSNTFIIDKKYKNKNIEFYIDFSKDRLDEENDFNSYVEIKYNGQVVSKSFICRYIKQNRKDSSIYISAARSFKSEDFVIDDSDIPSGFSGDEEIYMILYATAFGWDHNMVELYSDPVYLGEFIFEVDSFQD